MLIIQRQEARAKAAQKKLEAEERVKREAEQCEPEKDSEGKGCHKHSQLLNKREGLPRVHAAIVQDAGGQETTDLPLTGT